MNEMMHNPENKLSGEVNRVQSTERIKHTTTMEDNGFSFVMLTTLKNDFT